MSQQRQNPNGLFRHTDKEASRGKMKYLLTCSQPSLSHILLFAAKERLNEPEQKLDSKWLLY